MFRLVPVVTAGLVRGTFHGNSIMMCFNSSSAAAAGSGGGGDIVFYCRFVDLSYILFICIGSDGYYAVSGKD